MLIDTNSPDLLQTERDMLRPIAERLEATARLRCQGEGARPVTVLTIDATKGNAAKVAAKIERRLEA